MKVTLLMAITINGYIAGKDDDTDWVKDIEALKETIADFGVIVMGRRTYEECMKYSVFPYKGALNLVLTQDKAILSKLQENVLFSDKTPKEIIDLTKEKGFRKLLIVGGGHVNGSFLKDNLIDEINLDIHPMIMANGIHLFESDFPYKNLKFVSSKQINDQILQVKYNVKK